METSGVAFRSQACFSSTVCRKNDLSSLSGKPRRLFSGELKMGGFSEDGHLRYYKSIRCGGKKTERQDVIVKKKLKLVKGLSKDLLMFSEMGLVVDDHKQTISEATKILLAQLEQLKADRKDIKRKKKEEKAMMKAAKSMNVDDESPSSSSSDSSDDECEQVVNMKHLRKSAVAKSNLNTLSTTVATEPSITTSSECCQKVSAGAETELDKFNLEIQTLLKSQNPLSVDATEEDRRRLRNSPKESLGREVEGRINVCMGGKCKKMGAMALKEELETKVGVKGSVVGCKCMGKCRSAPNVRVSANVVNGADTSIRTTSNPLYIGVGLEDVDAIASFFLGEESNNVSLMAA